MQKVLVAEFDSSSTIVNAFTEMTQENPKFLGRGVSAASLNKGNIGISLMQAVADLEKNIGPVGSLGEIPFYAISSHGVLNDSEIQEIQQMAENLIVSPNEAVKQAALLIYKELGDTLVINVEECSTDLYLMFYDNNISQDDKVNQIELHVPECFAKRNVEGGRSIYDNALALVKIIGDEKICMRYGRDWRRLLNSRPKTPEEIAFSAEIIDAAIKVASQQLNERYPECLREIGRETALESEIVSRVGWIVGTGKLLHCLPNAFEVMGEGLGLVRNTELSLEGPALLVDKDSLLSSLGVLAEPFRPAAWQLLRESLGVEN